MKLIPLTQGKFAKVDDEDYEYLMKYSWSAEKSRNGKWYARRSVVNGISVNVVRMHRSILGVNKPDNCVDHINGDGLDNRRENLRACKNFQNLQNRGKQSNNSSGYKGVFRPTSNPTAWAAKICVKGKQIHLGVFSTPQEASLSYENAARKYFGEFAHLE